MKKTKEEIKEEIIDQINKPCSFWTRDMISDKLDEYAREAEAVKMFEIDFAGHVKAKISITGNTPTIDAAMNGWGNPISPEDITVDELPAPYQERGT